MRISLVEWPTHQTICAVGSAIVVVVSGCGDGASGGPGTDSPSCAEGANPLVWKRFPRT